MTYFSSMYPLWTMVYGLHNSTSALEGNIIKSHHIIEFSGRSKGKGGGVYLRLLEMYEMLKCVDSQSYALKRGK